MQMASCPQSRRSSAQLKTYEKNKKKNYVNIVKFKPCGLRPVIREVWRLEAPIFVMSCYIIITAYN